jgi:hypothetical protein
LVDRALRVCTGKGGRRQDHPKAGVEIVELQQKISGCWRALAGAQAFLTVRSYISTARKQGTTLAVLRQLSKATPGSQTRQAPEQLPAG